MPGLNGQLPCPKIGQELRIVLVHADKGEVIAMDLICAHVLVSGRVQGVFFRDSTREEARNLVLTGWVRNLHDGRVEAVIEGTRAAVEKLINFMRSGPRYSEVSTLDASYREASGEFSNFDIRPGSDSPC